MESKITIPSQPMPYLLACGHKVFAADEVHCTRNPKYYVLILMRKGTLKFWEEGREIALSKEQWYIQRQGVFHRGTSPCPDAEYFYIHFGAGDVSAGGTGNGVLELPLAGRFYDPAYIDMINTIWKCFSSGPWNQLEMQSVFLRLLGQLYRENTPIDPRVQQILNYVKAHYKEHITSEVLSKEFNFSEKYIERLVKRQFQMTPHQYLTQVRLDHAKQLLDQTNIPLKEVAESCGFLDPSVFYRVFRKKYGIGPGQWRKIDGNVRK